MSCSQAIAVVAQTVFAIFAKRFNALVAFRRRRRRSDDDDGRSGHLARSVQNSAQGSFSSKLYYSSTILLSFRLCRGSLLNILSLTFKFCTSWPPNDKTKQFCACVLCNKIMYTNGHDINSCMNCFKNLLECQV